MIKILTTKLVPCGNRRAERLYFPRYASGVALVHRNKCADLMVSVCTVADSKIPD